MSTIKIGRHSLKISNPDKVIFPDDGLTKRHLVDYYGRISDVMLSHLKGRPLTLHRFPEGIRGEGFYQQRAPDFLPNWISRKQLQAKRTDSLTHIICHNAASLAYLANLACITLHIWLSRADMAGRPDRMIFDLDPPENRFELARRCARETSRRRRESPRR